MKVHGVERKMCCKPDIEPFRHTCLLYLAFETPEMTWDFRSKTLHHAAMFKIINQILYNFWAAFSPKIWNCHKILRSPKYKIFSLLIKTQRSQLFTTSGEARGISLSSSFQSWMVLHRVADLERYVVIFFSGLAFDTNLRPTSNFVLL